MTTYPGQTLTQTKLGQLYAARWDSQSQLVVIQPETEPRSVVMPLALRCSALDHCATREPNMCQMLRLKNVIDGLFARLTYFNRHTAIE